MAVLYDGSLPGCGPGGPGTEPGGHPIETCGRAARRSGGNALRRRQTAGTGRTPRAGREVGPPAPVCRRRLAARTPGSQPGDRGFESRWRHQNCPNYDVCFGRTLTGYERPHKSISASGRNSRRASLRSWWGRPRGGANPSSPTRMGRRLHPRLATGGTKARVRSGFATSYPCPRRWP